ncbi:MAG: bifunctional adenosylcobinamide kinase/adenosylcobinamide-phosphate guanylyltransferase [Desulfobacteraceae bacterium]
MKKRSTLVIGGCRSGKSRYALELANQTADNNKIFMATSVPRDTEMKKRVTKHRAERGDSWQTEEIPVDIPRAMERLGKLSGVILVDCLTLWTSNLLAEGYEEEEIGQWITRLQTAVETARCPVILVSNEVGTGIVPENSLARQFRDMAGLVNQSLASSVTSVVWTVAGIPVTIKA